MMAQMDASRHFTSPRVAGRGRKPRLARVPGEGQPTAMDLGNKPLTLTLSPQAGLAGAER
jgi:hypothetical protein